jgi:hypothetical protein
VALACMAGVGTWYPAVCLGRAHSDACIPPLWQVRQQLYAQARSLWWKEKTALETGQIGNNVAVPPEIEGAHYLLDESVWGIDA